MQNGESGINDVECEEGHMSIPNGMALLPAPLVMVSLECEGRGNWNVRAIPASVANPMKGMVKMSMPRATCLRM